MIQGESRGHESESEAGAIQTDVNQTETCQGARHSCGGGHPSFQGMDPRLREGDETERCQRQQRL
jgi:hypothetical protein